VPDASPFANHGTRGGTADPGADDPAVSTVVAPIAPCAAGVGGFTPPASELAGSRIEWVGPNPMTSGAVIAFTVDSPGHVSIDVVTPDGRLVRRLYARPSAPGRYEVSWNVGSAGEAAPAPGVYVVMLRGAHRVETRKLIVVP
jgi:hypothetical protein